MKTLRTAYTPVDIKTLLGTDVIGSHIKLDYSLDSTYLDVLCANCWAACEDYLLEDYGVGTYSFEAESITTEFALPLDASRIDTITVEYWDGDAYQTVTGSNVYKANLGYPTTVKVDCDDAAYRTSDSEDTMAPVKGTYTTTAKTVDASLKQAFLLYLGQSYQQRESVISGMTATEIPMGFKRLLDSHRLLRFV